MISVDWKILFICLWMICLMIVGWLDKQYCLINIYDYMISFCSCPIKTYDDWIVWLKISVIMISVDDFGHGCFFVRVDFIATAQRGSASASSDEIEHFEGWQEPRRHVSITMAFSGVKHHFVVVNCRGEKAQEIWCLQRWKKRTLDRQHTARGIVVSA